MYVYIYLFIYLLIIIDWLFFLNIDWMQKCYQLLNVDVGVGNCYL